ncbi:transglutaminase family protein [Stieleria varia]|uniref:Transglutaminase-like superfamily protein n=1 Tax=Stieleria varia TaxID=2528005 RepID=A0A5C6A5K8_9BACT|nr:transglutaminase domain-containing protein [Stieleria varia]TWT94726.1 Transglutaminase-like superfamily protein [Stieleria varia]
MPTWSRRRTEVILLSLVAIASVIPLRFHVESRSWFLGEMVTLCVALIAAETARVFGDRSGRAKRVANLATLLLSLTPVLFAFLARRHGSPIAFEMSALTTFGAVSLAVAVSATSHRTRSLSLIISGFLVLFSASISDSPNAALLPIIWMLGCVWHLIANHWERLDLAMPASVERTWSLRPGLLIVTLVVLLAGGYAVKDHVGASRRLAGLMPTSGGSAWSDPAARSGVGTGNFAIAAKDHAESFGAVDSDIFLESTESTLFDMVNDAIGDAIKKNKWERRQAMGNENVIPMHEQAAKSEQGGGTFSTERMPPPKHHHFADAKDASIVQWDGPTGIRLAMQRYDTFDGRDWSQSADLKQDKLVRVDVSGNHWFFEPFMRGVLDRSPDAATVGLLKVIRLQSQRLPVPMLTAGIHIKAVDRQDFFGIEKDGSFFMPGREKVPPLTVIHVAGVGLKEDDIRDNLVVKPAKGASLASCEFLDESTRNVISELVRTAIAGHRVPADQLTACVEKLRHEFTFDRNGESIATSLPEFLQSRRGGDHLFATTAALMAREIGLPSRLATGFYVRDDAFNIAAGHSSVLAEDVHVWAEVQLDDGRWFEIEPTPGYEQPHYQPSWGLTARRFAAAHWPSFAGGMLVVAAGYVTRQVWMDWLLTAMWSLAGWLRPRHRIRLAIRIIETRARMAGHRRPPGKTQRAWLQQLTATDARLASAAERFTDVADALVFGHGNAVSFQGATELVDLLRLRTITALTKERARKKCLTPFVQSTRGAGSRQKGADTYFPLSPNEATS